MVLRRLAGQTEHTAPVLTLITQFGGGKTHTLTALYHLARSGATAVDFPGIPALLHDAGLLTVPSARVGVFVGNAWDPQAGRETPYSPRLMLVVLDPSTEWSGSDTLRQQLAMWTRHRGTAPRLYPGALVWCVKKPGRDLRDKVELWLAWQRVARDVAEGRLGTDFDRTDRAEAQTQVTTAEGEAHDEVWGGYRFVVLADNQEPDGLKIIDLGAGHASSSETLCGRVIAALKSQALLNDSVGAGYIERHWPPALKESGAWPLTSLRQSFLNGALTRLLDPDSVLRGKIVEFVGRGDFGLASGESTEGTYERIWYAELLAPEEVTFETGVFVLTKVRAQALRTKTQSEPAPTLRLQSSMQPEPALLRASVPAPLPAVRATTLRLTGTVPPEVWNHLGRKLLPKLRAGIDLNIGVEFSVTLSPELAQSMVDELRQILDDLGLTGQIRLEQQA